MIDILKDSMPVVAVIATMTGLVTEALKKMGLNLKANILAACTALVLSLAYCGGYVLLNYSEITPELIVKGVVLVLMSWLVSMIGYDKIKQTLGV